MKKKLPFHLRFLSGKKKIQNSSGKKAIDSEIEDWGGQIIEKMEEKAFPAFSSSFLLPRYSLHI